MQDDHLEDDVDALKEEDINHIKVLAALTVVVLGQGLWLLALGSAMTRVVDLYMCLVDIEALVGYWC